MPFTPGLARHYGTINLTKQTWPKFGPHPNSNSCNPMNKISEHSPAYRGGFNSSSLRDTWEGQPLFPSDRRQAMQHSRGTGEVRDPPPSPKTHSYSPFEEARWTLVQGGPGGCHPALRKGTWMVDRLRRENWAQQSVKERSALAPGTALP